MFAFEENQFLIKKLWMYLFIGDTANEINNSLALGFLFIEDIVA